jgi:hypothetical protein
VAKEERPMADSVRRQGLSRRIGGAREKTVIIFSSAVIHFAPVGNSVMHT